MAFSIPLVLAMTFAGMQLFDVGLHKISLGALILALGLLVDDAIIAIEMMAIKMEQGYSRLQAAGHAWRTTAFPMLTGTLITAAGFADCHCSIEYRGIYPFDFPGGDHRIAGVLDCRGTVCALFRR